MATDWRETWRKKLVPAAAAMKHIQAGNRVFIGSACGEPQTLVRALVESGENAEDTELLNVLTMGVAPYTELRYAERFRANAFFIGHGLREAVGQRRAASPRAPTRCSASWTTIPRSRCIPPTTPTIRG